MHFNLDLRFASGEDYTADGRFDLSPGQEYTHVSMYYNTKPEPNVDNFIRSYVTAYRETDGKDDGTVPSYKCSGSAAVCDANCNSNSNSTNGYGTTNNNTQPNSNRINTPQPQNNQPGYTINKADLERQAQEENNRMQQQAIQAANKKQQFINVYNEGVALGNTGKYSEAATKYQQAIGLATNETDRQTAQNAYNKATKTGNQLQAINQATSTLTDAAKIIDAANEEKRKQKQLLRQQEEDQKQEAEQNRISDLNANRNYYYDVASNYDNTEMQQYVDYIVYQGYKVGFNFDKMYQNCISNDGGNNAIRQCMFSLKKGADKMTFSLKFIYNVQAGLKRQFFMGCEADECSVVDLGTIFQGTGFTNKGKRMTASFNLLPNAVPPPTLQSYFDGSPYKGYREEGGFDMEENKKAYLSNALKCDCFEGYDFSMPILWYEKAIAAGDTFAVSQLAYLYEKKLANYSKAVDYYTQYYNLKADSGTAFKIAEIYYRKLNQDKEAMNWYKTTAGFGGNTNACRIIAVMYAKGQGTNVNFEDAKDWFIKMAERGDYSGYNYIGDSYYDGLAGVAKDYNEAKNWYLKAAEKGLAIAMSNLAFVYENGGPNLKKDKAEAKMWKKKACELDSKYCK